MDIVAFRWNLVKVRYPLEGTSDAARPNRRPGRRRVSRRLGSCGLQRHHPRARRGDRCGCREGQPAGDLADQRERGEVSLRPTGADRGRNHGGRCGSGRPRVGPSRPRRGRGAPACQRRKRCQLSDVRRLQTRLRRQRRGHQGRRGLGAPTRHVHRSRTGRGRRKGRSARPRGTHRSRGGRCLRGRHGSRRLGGRRRQLPRHVGADRVVGSSISSPGCALRCPCRSCCTVPRESPTTNSARL